MTLVCWHSLIFGILLHLGKALYHLNKLDCFALHLALYHSLLQSSWLSYRTNYTEDLEAPKAVFTHYTVLNQIRADHMMAEWNL